MTPATPTQLQPPPPAASRAIQLLTTLGLTLALLLPALGAVMLASTRNDVRNDAEQSSANLVVALARDIARNIDSLDLSVQGAIDAQRLPGLADVPKAIRDTALFDRAATAEYLGAILLLDNAGHVTHASTGGGQALDLSDRDYFRMHQNNPAAGLYLSLPYRSRLRGGDPSIAISRRIAAPGGAFAGVGLGALRLAYFDHLFETLRLGRNGQVALVRLDGIMLARRPGKPGDAGRDVSRSPAFLQMAQKTRGSFVDRSPADGLERLYAFQRIGDLPLVLTVARATEDIYAGWWRKAVVIASVLLALSLATAVLCLLFRREMMIRLQAQRALLEAANRLRLMAATDSLTGIANRRAFQEALEQEWRLAARHRGELALLMIDADHFKAYNDTYGHPAGDRALCRLADAIRSTAGRPTDLAARIGGEEFVLLLPATGIEGATLLAERVCAAVHALAIPHAGSPFGRMTLCIGVAALVADPGSAPEALLKLADDAMYAAKAAGRDQVMAARSARSAPAAAPSPPHGRDTALPAAPSPEAGAQA